MNTSNLIFGGLAMVRMKDIIGLFESTYNVKLTTYGRKKLIEFCLIHGHSQVYDALKTCCNNRNHLNKLFAHIGDIFARNEIICRR